MKTILLSTFLILHSAFCLCGQTAYIGTMYVSQLRMTTNEPPPQATPFAWWKANGQAAVDGSNVTTIVDASGNGFDLYSAVTDKPAWRTNAFGTNSAYVFTSATSKQMRSGAFVLAQPFTIFAVVSNAMDTPSTRLVYDSTNATECTLWTQGSDTWKLYAGNTIGDGALTLSKAMVVAATFDGASTILYTNGVQAFTGDAGANSLHGFSFGAGFDGTTWDGLIAEIQIWTNTVDAAAISLSLKAQYGL